MLPPPAWTRRTFLAAGAALNAACRRKHAEGFRETFEVVQQIPTTFD